MDEEGVSYRVIFLVELTVASILLDSRWKGRVGVMEMETSPM